MNSVEILKAMGEDPQITHEVLLGLAHGTFDEWDCELDSALSMFGPPEFAIAARTGAGWLAYLKEHGHNLDWNNVGTVFDENVIKTVKKEVEE